MNINGSIVPYTSVTYTKFLLHTEIELPVTNEN